MKLIVAVLLIVPHLARADDVIDRVLNDVALPGVTAFAETTDALATAAMDNCAADSAVLLTAWNAAMDAWFGIQDLRFGPLEQNSRRQAIAYWPDSGGHRQKVLGRILSGEDPVLQTPDGYGAQSVAARGLYALETMLYDPAFNDYGPNDPGCILVEAISADLANTAAQVRDQWVNDFAAVMRTAGEPGNTQFLDVTEARQTVFTALMTSIQFDILERLGLPMGSFDQPRPSRAEGRLSGRSQRNLELSIAAHEKLAAALVADAALSTIEDFERARWMASQIGDPDFSGVQEPVGRFKLESLQTTLTLLRAEANREIGAVLGVTLGLNALDGD